MLLGLCDIDIDLLHGQQINQTRWENWMACLCVCVCGRVCACLSMSVQICLCKNLTTFFQHTHEICHVRRQCVCVLDPQHWLRAQTELNSSHRFTIISLRQQMLWNMSCRITSWILICQPHAVTDRVQKNGIWLQPSFSGHNVEYRKTAKCLGWSWSTLK